MALRDNISHHNCVHTKNTWITTILVCISLNILVVEDLVSSLLVTLSILHTTFTFLILANSSPVRIPNISTTMISRLRTPHILIRTRLQPQSFYLLIKYPFFLFYYFFVHVLQYYTRVSTSPDLLCIAYTIYLRGFISNKSIAHTYICIICLSVQKSEFFLPYFLVSTYLLLINSSAIFITNYNHRIK